MQKFDCKKFISDFKKYSTKKNIISAATILVAIAFLTTVIVLLAIGGNNTPPDNQGGNSGIGDNGGENGGENDDSKATYKVTVVDQDGISLAGATVEISIAANKYTATTDATGVATFESVAKAPYKTKVTLDGYKSEKSYTIDLGKTELTVTLTEMATYTVTVLDASGAPVADANVQFCVGAECKLPVPTDADGIAILELEKADYTIKVNGVEVPYSFDEGIFELTIQLD